MGRVPVLQTLAEYGFFVHGPDRGCNKGSMGRASLLRLVAPPFAEEFRHEVHIVLGKLGVPSIECMGVYGMAIGFHASLSF